MKARIKPMSEWVGCFQYTDHNGSIVNVELLAEDIADIKAMLTVQSKAKAHALRAVADAAGTCLDFYDNVLRNEKDFPQEAAMFDALRAALAALSATEKG